MWGMWWPLIEKVTDAVLKQVMEMGVCEEAFILKVLIPNSIGSFQICLHIRITVLKYQLWVGMCGIIRPIVSVYSASSQAGANMQP